MRALFAVVAVAGVGFVLWLVFAIGDLIRRIRRSAWKDPARVVPGERGRRVEFPTTLDPAQALERVASALTGAGARVSHRTEKHFIAFRGKGGGSLQFKGIGNIPSSDMPLAIAVVVEPGRVILSVANDFGWNLFVGPARGMYLSNLKSAMIGTVELVEGSLAPTGPGPGP